MSEKKIQAIYPLTFMQQSLLLHSLKEDQDQGFLQVKCKLVGELKPELLEQAWRIITDHHPVLRSSIHWENLEKPVQVVRKEVALNWKAEDWQGYQSDERNAKFERFLIQDAETGLELSKAPVFRVTLIKQTTREFSLVWSCHHIFLDGWSSALVLQDVFKCYHQLTKDMTFEAKATPSFDKYLDWLQSVDSEKTAEFWKTYLKDFDKPSLLVNTDQGNVKRESDFQAQVLTLTGEESSELAATLKQYQVTTNNFLLAIWGLFLSRILNEREVAFGTTVSGRSIDLPGIEHMTGLFTNVLPVRLSVDKSSTIQTWLATTQKTQAASRNFEFASLDQIYTWAEWPGHQALFDSLLVVENFPWKQLNAGEIEVQEFASGVTTTYPLNVIIKPGDELELVLRYDAAVIDSEFVSWIGENFKQLIVNAIQQKFSQVQDLYLSIDSIPDTYLKHQEEEINLSTTDKTTPTKYQPPSNNLELQLTKIWEEILGLNPVGVNDNFFEIGGRSIQAVRLFNEINNQLDRNLSPSMLLKHPTIASLAKVWDNAHAESGWSSLVPMRAGGSKPPLFAIHAGGAHTFFYLAMANHLDDEQPVYTLQPVGLDGIEGKHQSIEEMASHYIEVIKSIVPEGPFSVLGTCLSDPICVEINKQLRQRGEAPLAVVIVDSSPIHLFPREKKKSPLNDRMERFKQRYQEDPLKAIGRIFIGRYRRRMEPIKKKLKYMKTRYVSDKQTKQLRIMQDHLGKLYQDYQWGEFDGDITLIKTSENKNWNDDVWRELARGKVTVIETPANHYTVFKEPEVQGLAERLQKHLDHVYMESQVPTR